MSESQRPVDVIVARLAPAYTRSVAPGVNDRLQDAFAIIGALEQAGWMITRKRHFGEKP